MKNKSLYYSFKILILFFLINSCSYPEISRDELIYDNSLKASRYKLLGKEFTGDDVNIDIWYKDKKWVKMIFLKDGSTVEYFLKEYDSKKE